VRQIRDGERLTHETAASPDPLWMSQIEWPVIIHELGLGHPMKFIWEERAKSLITYPNFWKQFYRKFPQYRKATITAREFEPGERVEVDYECITKFDVLNWFSSKVDDLGNQVNALAGLLNVELRTSVGPLGEPGDELAILNVCRLFTDACARVLEWEESVRFCSLPRGLEKVKTLLVGLGGRNIERVFEIPSWISQIFGCEKPSGQHSLNIVFDMPDDWEESLADAFRQINEFYKS
jgi:hypothetical protein